jgi:vitamin B12/bleomycin/antimicrobial peptide transport system ATP-binding/permease protein
VNVGSFIGVLLSISPQLTLFVVAYSALGSALTLGAFGNRLKHLTFEGVKKEANFRFGLVRVREHAEEIAFYDGGTLYIYILLLYIVYMNIYKQLAYAMMYCMP